MLGLIDQFGFAAINAKAINGVSSDTVLNISFGSKRDQNHACESLTSYLNAIRQTASFVSLT